MKKNINNMEGSGIGTGVDKDGTKYREEVHN